LAEKKNNMQNKKERLNDEHKAFVTGWMTIRRRLLLMLLKS
jgi:hypothetical protein